jgi:hypothetical protein
MFRHAAAGSASVRPVGNLGAYHAEAQDRSITRFPRTFLNQEQIAESAGNAVLRRIRDEALVWIAAVAILFTLIQFGQFAYDRGSVLPPTSKIDSFDIKIKGLEARIAKLEEQEKSEEKRNAARSAVESEKPK